jgi:hypothetical protein
MMINWEFMVGGSHTRWHWNTPDGSPEPVIPWDAFMFPDLTPVSFVEAALVRNWTLQRNDFIAYEGFLPTTWDFVGDSYLTLAEGSTWSFEKKTDFDNMLVETTLWVNNTGGGLLLRSGMDANGYLTGYYVGFRHTSKVPLLVVEHWGKGGAITPIGDFDMTTLNCGFSLIGWNMLRATIDTVQSVTELRVWANPMYNESVSQYGIQPRILLQVPSALPVYASGNVTLVSTADEVSLAAQVFRVGEHSIKNVAPSEREVENRKTRERNFTPPLGDIVPANSAAFDYIGVLPLSDLSL